jgi:hypothetical protein
VPGVGGDFTLKELSVISVRFKEDAKGTVTGATFIQPQGVFEAPRKK